MGLMKMRPFSLQSLKRGEMAIILIVVALVVAAISAYLGSRYTVHTPGFRINLFR